MANGKFSSPRSSNSEEREIEAAFRKALGEDVSLSDLDASADIFADPASLSDDDLLADVMLEELLMEDEIPDNIVMEELFPDRVRPQPVEEIQEELPETTPTIRKNRKIVFLSLASVALTLVIGIALTVWFLFGGPIADDGLILQNVTVAGVNLGGMTQEEAASALHTATDLTYTSLDMVIKLPDTTITLTPTQTGAALDVEAAVQAAYEFGRTGSLSERRAAKDQVLKGQYHIGLLPYLSLNTSYIRQQLDNYGNSFNSTYCDSYYSIKGKMPALEGENFSLDNPCQTLILNAGSPGRNLDINAVYNQVLDAYSLNLFEVDASQAAPQETPAALDLEAILAEVYKEPVSATMDMETFEILPETYGYGFDIPQALKALGEVKPGTEVQISLEYIVPQDTTETLSAVLFRDVLSYAETPHTNNANRNNNLELACASIHGLVLMPGDVFSYNDALGERTPEAGYKAAAAYADGQTVLEYGGGICQVSSTLYYATLLADLEIVTRSAHSYVSSYIDFGMDATVSWGGPEFRFANNTDYPIRIEAEVSDGYVKVWIIGTDYKDYYVEMEYEIVGIRSYETIYEDYPEDNEKGYVDGEIIQTAYTGYTVKTYRCKYSKETGELISRELEATSRYNTRDLIIARVGAEETTDPSDPSTDPSDPTEPTDPPSTDPTEPPTETIPSTEPPTDPPTEPPTETQPPAPTEAPAEGAA